MTAFQALATIQNLPETESGDDSSGSEAESDFEGTDICSVSDVDSEMIDDSEESSESEDENHDGRNSTSTDLISGNDTKAGSSVVVTSKDGTQWKIATGRDTAGQFQQQNVLKHRAGTTAYSCSVSSLLDAFRCLVDEGLLRHIKTCTIEFARLSDADWSLIDAKLDT